MDLKIIYEDNDVLVVDKPAGVVVFPESTRTLLVGNIDSLVGKTLIDLLLEKHPDLKSIGEAPRYGIVHRLDKNTSGILLVAKNNESLKFLQKQFSAAAEAIADKKNRSLEKSLEKRYIALATGVIKADSGSIETLIGRSPADPRKQKVYSNILKNVGINVKRKREAITEFKVLKRFDKYTLIEVLPKTGRKHQIRCHMAYIHHPVAGDKLYGFKDSPTPKGLERQFLHASYLKIQLPNGQVKEFSSDLPEDLKQVLNQL